MARSARPFPCLRDSPRQRPKCLSLSRRSPRGAEATGHWNKSRSSTKKPCPIPSARLLPSSAPLGVTAPPLPRRVREKLPPPRRLRAASFSTEARTAPGREQRGGGAWEGAGGKRTVDAGGRAGHGAQQPSPGAEAPQSQTPLNPRTSGDAGSWGAGGSGQRPRPENAGPQGPRRAPKHLSGHHHPQVRGPE